MSAATCFVRRCKGPSVGPGPFSGHPVCQTHYNMEQEKVGSMRVEQVKPNLEELQQLLAKQRALQQRLYCERQELETAFDSAMDALEAGKRRLIGQVEAELAVVNDGMSYCERAEKLGRQIQQAQQTHDVSHAMRLSGQLAPLKAAAVQAAEPGAGVQVNLGPRALGLELLVEEELRKIFKETDASQAWTRLASHSNFDGRPVALAACRNAAGYVALTSPTAAKPVVTLATAANGRLGAAVSQFGSPCAVVALANNDAAAGDNDVDNQVPGRRLCLVSLLDSKQAQPAAIQLAAGLGDADRIVGLHCDCPLRCPPGRQRLFVAMTTSCVLVVGLDGQSLARVTEDNVGQPLGRIASLSGTQDKLLIYRCEPDCQLLAVAKEAEVVGTLHCQVAMPEMRLKSAESVSALGSHCAIVTDSVSGGCDVWCLMSRMRLDRLKPAADEQHRPTSVAADSRGIVFTCSPQSATVQALTSDGRRLHSLAGGGGADNFKAPLALAVCEFNPGNEAAEDNEGRVNKRRLLVVADAANKRIVAFSLP
uniref:WD_REPEATS_REGION domain-containing protein n=2 Tax=Macrostomum lignano TaxID=282301 RepID=A0A1I8FWZ2_9PLAT